MTLCLAILARGTCILIEHLTVFPILTGCLEYQRNVHVSLRGNDSKRCGSIKKPCRTITKAVTRVSWDGMVILDGSGTAKQPYNCEQLTTRAHHPGIRVTRSVTMTSLPSTEAHVTCPKGFHFHGSNESLRISLSGLSFSKTTLKFIDCGDVEIINCTLRKRHSDKTAMESAVVIRVQNISKVNVTIRDSVFQNNSLCVRIYFEQQSLKKDRLFSLTVTKTKFLENGFHTQSPERGAIVFSANETPKKFSQTIYLQITMNEVHCLGGGGHFLDVDLPTAVTTEAYHNINLERNHFMTSRSLYYSNVSMATVAFVDLQCVNNSEVRCITVQSFTNANRTIDLKVNGSRFYDNKMNKMNRTVKAATLQVTGTTSQSGTINIFNTSFVQSSEVAVSLTPNFNVCLEGVTVRSSLYGVRMVAYDAVVMNDSNFYLFTSIHNCTFRNNLMDVYGLLNNTVRVDVQVTNTVFDGKEVQEYNRQNATFGIRIIIPLLDKQIPSKVNVEIENATFAGRPTNAFVFVAKGNKTITLRGCKFRDSFSLETNEWIVQKYENLPGYMTGQGAFLFLFDSDKLVDRGCVKGGERHDTHAQWIYNSRVLVENTLFQNNFGYEAGAIQIINGYVQFRRCNFTNNFALSDTGHVYVGYGSARVEFQNCAFKREEGKEGTFKGISFTVGRFLHSESGGPIKIKSTSFETKFSESRRARQQPVLRISYGGYFDIDSNSTIQCPMGSSLRFYNFTHFSYDGEQDSSFCRINVTTEIFACLMCRSKMYSLQSGFSRGLSVRKGFSCLECPFGAHCKGPINIVAKRDFWGYKITNSSNFSSLTFVPCPEKYCSGESHYHQDFNRCYGYRQGVLCGRCAPGFTESLFSTKCRKADECRCNFQLWLFMAIYTIVLTFYLLKKPPLVRFLKDQIFWFKRDRHQQNLQRDSVLEKEESENGYIRITFYFYQVFDLLSTTSVETMMEKVPYISTMVAAFNFEVHILDKKIGCPFAGLTAVTKEMFLSALVFVAIGHVFMTYCLNLVVYRILKKHKPLFVHYVAVAMEILLLGYERLAETSLKLMHCVPIGSELRLYYDGNVVCWQWWQHCLLAFNVIFVVPFVGVLYLGSGKLYNKTISWKQFIGACIVPLPFLVYWLVKRSHTKQRGNPASQIRYSRLSSLFDDENASHDSEECTNEISNILLGPFRPPSAHDQGTLYWESVLIGRRLVLLIFRAFIPNFMVCSFCMSFACILMAVHHSIKKPFRDRTADRMETFSLITLSCIATINVTTATLASSAVRPEGPNKSIIVVLRWIQVALLSFPFALFALLILFALLSQLVRFVILLKRKIWKGRTPNI